MLAISWPKPPMYRLLFCAVAGSVGMLYIFCRHDGLIACAHVAGGSVSVVTKSCIGDPRRRMGGMNLGYSSRLQ